VVDRLVAVRFRNLPDIVSRDYVLVVGSRSVSLHDLYAPLTRLPTPVLPLDDIAMHRSKFVVEWLRVMIVDQHEPFARSEAIERIEQHLVSPLRYQVTHVERPQLPVTERFLFRYPGLARFGVRILVGPVEGTVSFDLILDQKSVDISIGNNENFGICLGLVERVVDPFLELVRRVISQIDFSNHLSDRTML